MAQVALQFTTADPSAVEPSLRLAHAQFLARHRSVLVTFGTIRNADQSPAGYAYQTDFPGISAEGIHQFLLEDPFAKAGLYRSSSVSGWRCALDRRQATTPSRPGYQGFFFHGIAKPDMTERRNAMADAHRAHLTPHDDPHCLARGGLTDKDGLAWLGSSMVYEFPDRKALDAFFSNEPFYTGGLYECADIYLWQRGDLAAA